MLSTTTSRRAAALLALASLAVTACSEDLSTADPAPAGPEGEAGMLYVQHVSSGSVTSGDPSGTEAFEVQIEVDPATVFFTDRPARVAGQMQTAAFVDEFAQLFPGSPPNAVLEVQDGDRTISAPVTLDAASYDDTTGVLTYTVTNLPAPTEGYASATGELGDVPDSFGEASVFIDDAVSSLTQGNTVHDVTSGESSVAPHVGVTVLQIHPLQGGELGFDSTWSGVSFCYLWPQYVQQALSAVAVDPSWCGDSGSSLDFGVEWDEVYDPLFIAVSLPGLGLMGKAFDVHVNGYRNPAYATVHFQNVVDLP